MTADPRAALALLVSALERHLEVATTRRDPDDPGVISAAEALAEAFDDYDEILFAATEVATPLAVYGDEDDFDDDDDDEVDARAALDGEATVYAGLDDEDVDFDDSDEDDEDDDDDSDEDDDSEEDVDDDDEDDEDDPA
jgi:hypothetical protein